MHKTIPGQVRVHLDSELCTLLKWIKANWNHPDPTVRRRAFMVAFIIASGLRIQEAASLRLDHCSVSEGWLWVEDGKGHKDRHVTFMPEFKAAFEDYVSRLPQHQVFLLQSQQRGPHAFRTKPISTRTGEMDWAWVCDQAGVRNLAPHHGGRRTHATWWANFQEISVVSQRMGHADTRTTLKHYIDEIPGHWPDGQKPQWMRVMGTIVRDAEPEAEDPDTVALAWLMLFLGAYGKRRRT